jgi:hypothetical protein
MPQRANDAIYAMCGLKDGLDGTRNICAAPTAIVRSIYLTRSE